MPPASPPPPTPPHTTPPPAGCRPRSPLRGQAGGTGGSGPGAQAPLSLAFLRGDDVKSSASGGLLPLEWGTDPPRFLYQHVETRHAISAGSSTSRCDTTSFLLVISVYTSAVAGKLGFFGRGTILAVGNPP